MCNAESLCRQVESAVSTLDELLDALVRASHDGSTRGCGVAGVGWLRPLAMRIVELEYTVRYRARVEAEAVREACNELVLLLESTGPMAGDFSERYIQERAASDEASQLHARACAACRSVQPGGAFARGTKDSTVGGE
jgi:hypothetical protein